MYYGILTVEIMAVVILAIIAYAQNTTQVNDKSDKCFRGCIYLCLLGLAGDIVMYSIILFRDSYINSVVYRAAAAVSYGIVFAFFARLFNYYELLADVKESTEKRVFRTGKYILYCFTVIIIILGFMGQVIFEQNGKSVHGPAYSMLIVMHFIIMAMSFTTYFLVRKNVGKQVVTALILGILISAAIIAVSFFTVGINYGYPALATTLLITYVLVQAQRVDYSRYTKVKEELAMVEETNRLLKDSYAKLEEDQRSIDAIASMYYTMHYIDFEKGEYKEIACANRISGRIEKANKISSLQETLWTVMVDIAREDYKDEALRFTNLSTLETRLAGKNSVSVDIKNYNNETWRFTFIRIGNNKESLSKAIYASQLLEEENK